MIPRLRNKLSYSNVVASLALFIALGGAAVAAGIPNHSVGPKQLKRGAVTSAAIRKGAINSAKLAQSSVVAGKIASNTVVTGNLANGAVTSGKVAKNAVTNGAIANGVVGTNKLGNEIVTTAKLQKEGVTGEKIKNGSVTAAKLGGEIGPLLGTLKSGQTLRGSFDIGGKLETAREGTSFPFPLLAAPAAPEANILSSATSSAACPGLKGGNQETPEAAAGQLCVYIRNSLGTEPKLFFSTLGLSRLGFALKATFSSAAEENDIIGFWAVTAP